MPEQVKALQPGYDCQALKNDGFRFGRFFSCGIDVLPGVGKLDNVNDIRKAAKTAGTGSSLRRIKITDEDLQHAIEGHKAFGSLSRRKSIFFDGEDLVKLIRRAENSVPLRQRNGNLAYVVDAGREIGVDRFTGLPTSQYTVIARPDRTFVTTFPGLPPGKGR